MNRSRKLSSVITASVLGLTGLLTAAPAAQAVNQTFTVADCRGSLNSQTFSVFSGNDLRINFTSCAGSLFLGSNPAPTSGTSVTIGGATFASNAPHTFLDGWDGSSGPLPDGSFTVYYRNTSPTVYDGVFTVSVGGSAPAPSPTTSDSTVAPIPIVQQFGKPATGTCDEAQPEGLDLSGVPSGGWGVSWAQWMNAGNGGAVCTRTIIYSPELSRWVVG